MPAVSGTVPSAAAFVAPPSALLTRDLPFFGVIMAAAIALLVMFLVWNKPEIRALTRRTGG